MVFFRGGFLCGLRRRMVLHGSAVAGHGRMGITMMMFARDAGRHRIVLFDKMTNHPGWRSYPLEGQQRQQQPEQQGLEEFGHCASLTFHGASSSRCRHEF